MYFGCPLQHFINVAYYSFIIVLLQGHSGKLETFTNQCFPNIRGALNRKVLTLFFCLIFELMKQFSFAVY